MHIIKEYKQWSSYLYSVKVLLLLFLCNCEGKRPRSILQPAGPHAEQIAWLWWLMFDTYGVVYLATLLLLVLALLARKREKPVLGSRFVVIAGIVIPTVILIVMLFFELRVSRGIHSTRSDFHVQVIGHGWWFEVRYPDYNIVDANEIHIPVNQMIRFELSARGMIHSFWVPKLGGKRDQLPDHANNLHLMASIPGMYHGTCTEYCAGQHARMAFRLVAHTQDDFNRWLLRNQQLQEVPSQPRLMKGMQVFSTAGCASCHSIRGFSQADIGPDLTYIGSRLTLGAGQLENTWGSLSGWIANSQALKPNNQMPRTYLSPEDLHALTDYLWSLQ